MKLIGYEFIKDESGKVDSKFEYDGSLIDMCDGIVRLVEDVLEQYADKHPIEPKEYIADIVKRKLIEDISELVDSKYNMDDLFERTILESEEEEDVSEV